MRCATLFVGGADVLEAPEVVRETCCLGDEIFRTIRKQE